uniref:Macrophage mannose receptor 1-like n=1 Tax=Saccoglossus kowalevskii TaxID=10224 RepID=A0ABM0MA34_SACKO
MDRIIIFLSLIAVSTATHVEKTEEFLGYIPSVSTCTTLEKRYEIYCQQDETVHPYRQKAQEFCESRGGTLANIKNPEEDAEIRDFIYANKMDSRNCVPNNGFWIGLHDGDGEEEGNYKWGDGTTPCYFNWAIGNPNNNEKKNATSGQDCTQLWCRRNKGILWDDDYCDFRPKGIICEFI